MKIVKLSTSLVLALFSFYASAQSLFVPSGTIGNSGSSYLYTPSNTMLGIGTVTAPATSPSAYLHIQSPNGSATPYFQATMAGTTLGDFFKLVNGTGNTTTFTPTLWSHNGFLSAGSVIPSFSLVGSTTSAADITSANAIVNINARQLNGVTGSPVLNRNVFQVSNYASTLFSITSNGNVGIGTTTPIAKLDVAGGVNVNGNIVSLNSVNPLIQVGSSASSGMFMGMATSAGSHSPFSATNDAILSTNVGAPGNLIIQTQGNGNAILFGNAASNNTSSEKMRLTSSGTLLIGTTCNTTNAKLAVNGKIYAKSMQILLPTLGCFPDYVFEKDYKLMPLVELEKYINANKHLPEVPTAEEAEREGIDVAGMNTILLKKVEELTLHLIELKKENETLQLNNKTTEAKLDELSQQIQVLIKQR